ncbi:glycosyltransferase family 2 protein [Winogradskyella maritima]|uniref:Glycosyltransferase family 2 protein n=1 Tax=Winogradskyella maritima TaxID=1517766 RepID=A0ABV8AKF5_9FLAO|nr:glycosyltransferase family 2 protein [Winogradskyella maritima]
MKITALAITYNEATHLQRYLDEMQFADEIIIVDSFSTDDTLKIAEANNAKVIQREFKNFSDQKNFALSQASHDWVAFFDPDEALSEDLINELKSLKSKTPEAAAYSVRRQYYFMDKKMKYSGFQTDWVVRFFNRKYCSYNGNLVHETLDINGTTSKLKHRLDHYSYKGFDAFNDKLTHYATLQADKLYEKNVRPNAYHFLFRPWYRFWHQYLIRLGILDGKEGFILAYCQAFSVFKRYLILWAKYRRLH